MSQTTNCCTCCKSTEFKSTFDDILKTISEQFDILHSIKKNVMTTGYGAFHCSYKMRYITPKEISEFISTMTKCVKNGLISTSIGDINHFMTSYALKFLNDKNCSALDRSVMGNNYQIDKDSTLNEILLLCHNEVYATKICSTYEQTKRIECIQTDLKTMQDMHFVANLKSVVNSMETIFKKMCETSEDEVEVSPIVMDVMSLMIEEFILFAATINSITLASMIDYVAPDATFSPASQNIKDNYNIDSNESMGDSYKQDIEIKEHATINTKKIWESFTECCLLKTNDLTINMKLPFDCNFRNVVLQDVTPDFKDTKSALHFILKDGRSPLTNIIAKYSDEHRPHMRSDRVRNIFFNKQHFEPQRDILKMSDFHTDVNWLDKIAYGNIAYDSNYRNDAVGNNKFNPIVNKLETLYQLFSTPDDCCIECVINNILEVISMMESIINEYASMQNMDYSTTRDILAVLGEILTRDIIKVYHMSTRVVCVPSHDTMNPTAYIESFVMEDGENNNNNQSSNKVTVSAGTNTQQSTIQKVAFKVGQFLQRFAQYIRNVIGAIFTKFNENHKAEESWINSHKQLNEEIGKNIGNNAWSVNVSNYRKLNTPGKEVLENIKPQDAVKKYLQENNGKSDPAADNGTLEQLKKDLVPEKLQPFMSSIVKESFSLFQEAPTDNTQGETKNDNTSTAPETKNDNTSTDKAPETPFKKALRNWIMYGNPNQEPQPFNGPLSAENWNDILTNLTGESSITKFLGKVCQDLTKNLDTCIRDLTAKRREEEQKFRDQQKNNNQNNNSSENAPSPVILPALNTIKDITTNLYIPMLKIVMNDMYGKEYNTYRDIVRLYNQQKGSITTANNSGQQNENQNNVGGENNG